MSEKEYCGIQDFSKYDEMTTEELQEILRLDAENTEGQDTDVETLLYITGVLAERRKKNGQTGNTAQEAYEIFKQHYMPEIDNKDSFPAKKSNPKTIRPRWMRGLVAAAAALAIVISCSVTANAFGIDMWKAVVQWTQDTFNFGNSAPDSKLPYMSLQEALEKGNTPTWLAPTRIPDGFEMSEITAELTPLKKEYRAIYTNGDEKLRITIQDYWDKAPVYVEQNDGLVEEYEVAGITYYLFSDNDIVKAVWTTGTYECNIMGKVTIQDLKMMIDSIEKG